MNNVTSAVFIPARSVAPYIESIAVSRVLFGIAIGLLPLIVRSVTFISPNSIPSERSAFDTRPESDDSVTKPPSLSRSVILVGIEI